MKNRIILSVLFIFHISLFTLPAQAQRSLNNTFFGVTVEGGMNTMNYSSLHGERAGGFGYGVGAYLAYFPTRNIGFSLGLQLSRVQASVTYNFSETTLGLTHPDNPGVYYDLTTDFDQWVERQSARVLSLPVEFLWRVNMEKMTLRGGIGAQVDLPHKGHYTAVEGSYTTTGYFPATGHTVANQPQHGFGEYGAEKESDISKLGIGVSLIADLGVCWPLSSSMNLYVGFYGRYGLNNVLQEGRDNPLVVLDPANSAHSIYYGSFASQEVTDMNLFCVGIKVGLDFGSN